jgi:molecular chaperone DnaK
MPDVQPIGIDLGTTCSAVAYIDEHGKTAMVRNAEGELLTPSVVLFDEGEIIVGREAKKAAGSEVGKVAECAKRDMGRESYAKLINGKEMPPEVIQAYILKKLMLETEQALGTRVRAVITVPAFFDEVRRKATADAGEMAGLEVLDIVNEPTAAALAFGEAAGYLSNDGTAREMMRVLVYDLGGGTFDVTLLELRPGDVRTLATDGDTHLGGHDWDQHLAEHAADAFAEQHGSDPREDPGSLIRLMRAVEEAKHTLSIRNRTKIHIEHAGRTFDVPLTREEFKEITGHLLERTAYTAGEVLRVAGMTWKDVTKVLLVGGSTRMPMVPEMLEELTGLKPDSSIYPDEAVARGAALFAKYKIAKGAGGKSTGSKEKPDFTVVDVNSHSLGILGIDQETNRKENVIVIPRNSPLPTAAARNFVTKKDNQKSIVVQVLEGESTVPDHCSVIGKAVLRDLPPGLKKGWPIRVTYRYGTNGRLAVRAVVPGTEREIVMELEREQGLSSDRLKHWKQVLTAEVGRKKSPSTVPAEQKSVVVPAGRKVPPAAQRIAKTAKSSTAAASPSPSPPSPPTAPQANTVMQAAAAPVTSSAASVESALRPRKKRGLKAWQYIAGYVISATVGLSIGYVLMCMINPEADFLNLWAPTVEAPSEPPNVEE